jgi:subtilase family serine protease
LQSVPALNFFQSTMFISDHDERDKSLQRRISATITTTTLLVVLLASISATHTFSAQAATSKVTRGTTSSTDSTKSFTANCLPALKVGQMSCLSLMSTTPIQATFAEMATLDAASTSSIPPYGPNALHKAYNLPTKAATPQTVAIIDAGDDPNAEKDMNIYRQIFGIPVCTTANGCFKKVDQKGGTNLPPPDVGAAGETSLDLDMVSAICQNCHILLVEANSLTAPDLGAAENEAVKLGANEVSNSFGGPEGKGDAQFCNQFFNHPGVVITASSGDSGPGVFVPADCPNVVSVGGTTLEPNGTETAWNTSATVGAGGGCSALFRIPPWQALAIKQGTVTTNCAKRAGADVSAVADPATGVLVVDTFGQIIALHQVGGTSVSAPLIAAVYALAGGAPTATSPSGAIIPWTKIAKGAKCLNSVEGKTYAFQTGLGTPNGIGCF